MLKTSEQDQTKSIKGPQNKDIKGKIVSIDGPIIGIKGLKDQKIGDLLKIGSENLIGEIINITKDKTVAQCYDFTEGLQLFEEVTNLCEPLSMELGPGLMSNVFDGIQRSLLKMSKDKGAYISNKDEMIRISHDKEWHFTPIRNKGEFVLGGYILGEVPETNLITHKIMVPTHISGDLTYIAPEGFYSVDDKIATIKTADEEEIDITMVQKWPIRRPRPTLERIKPKEPIITGMRALDVLFPISRGASVGIPGGFGTGKTVTLQSLAKYSNSDIIIYVHCGERGIELAQMLEQFPKLSIPNLPGSNLMDRTIIIGHTSNMPVSARETSIFAGLTIAEYYRDMGYHCLLLTDSISRWVESLRELSARLEEMPAAGGFPSYMSKHLADFFERSGCSIVLGAPKRIGSVAIVGTVSPPAGDFSEPVTKTIKRYVKTFWVLDQKLSYSRMYPAINWVESYSGYIDDVAEWWEEKFPLWLESRKKVMDLFSKELEIRNVMLLVGKDNLPQEHQLVIQTLDLIRDGFLTQNAFDPIDAYSSPEKTMKILRVILNTYEICKQIIASDIPLSEIIKLEQIQEISKLKRTVPNDDTSKIDEFVLSLMKNLKRFLKYGTSLI